MKIIKEITLAVSADDIKKRLKDSDELGRLWASSDLADRSLRQNVSFSIAGDRAVREDFMAHTPRSGDKKRFHLTTLIEICPTGQRTRLTVTVDGCQKCDPDLVRMEMPRISLLWERRLILLKKSLETVSGRL